MPLLTLRAHHWIERTPAGSTAWRDSPMPPEQRRLLGALRQQTQVSTLLEQWDPDNVEGLEETIKSIARRGWVRVLALRQEADESGSSLISEGLRPLPSVGAESSIGEARSSTSTPLADLLARYDATPSAAPPPPSEALIELPESAQEPAPPAEAPPPRKTAVLGAVEDEEGVAPALQHEAEGLGATLWRAPPPLAPPSRFEPPAVGTLEVEARPLPVEGRDRLLVAMGLIGENEADEVPASAPAASIVAPIRPDIEPLPLGPEGSDELLEAMGLIVREETPGAPVPPRASEPATTESPFISGGADDLLAALYAVEHGSPYYAPARTVEEEEDASWDAEDEEAGDGMSEAGRRWAVPEYGYGAGGAAPAPANWGRLKDAPGANRLPAGPEASPTHPSEEPSEAPQPRERPRLNAELDQWSSPGLDAERAAGAARAKANQARQEAEAAERRKRMDAQREREQANQKDTILGLSDRLQKRLERRQGRGEDQ